MAKGGRQGTGCHQQRATHDGERLPTPRHPTPMIKPEKQAALAEANTAGTSRHPVVPAFLKVPAAVAYSGIGRCTLYELMGERKIKSHRIGAARVIDRASLEAFISSQPS